MERISLVGLNPSWAVLSYFTAILSLLCILVEKNLGISNHFRVNQNHLVMIGFGFTLLVNVEM